MLLQEVHSLPNIPSIMCKGNATCRMKNKIRADCTYFKTMKPGLRPEKEKVQ